MKSQRLIIILLFSIVLISTGIIYWFSEMESEKRFLDYLSMLEQSNCFLEEYPFSDSHVAGLEKIYYFSDFQSFVIQENINHIYYDREMDILYFFHPIGNNKVEIIFFKY